MKPDEQAAREYALKHIPISCGGLRVPVEVAHLDGQEHGAKAERERIWAAINSPESCKEWESQGEVTSDGLKRIIFGDEGK